MSKYRCKITIAIFLLYILLSLLLTYPVVTHFTTHVPGDGVDDPALAWNLWWVKYALLDLRQSPFDCDYMFYPIGINLAFFTLTVLNAVLSIPLQAIFGIIPTNNIILLSSYVLSGFGAYLLTRYLLERRENGHNTLRPYEWGENVSRHTPHTSIFISFVAGFIYAFSANKLLYAALGQFNIASSQWIPYYVLFLFKMLDNPRRVKFPLLAALFIILQAWAELTYASFLIVFTALFFVYHLRGASGIQSAQIRVNPRPKKICQAINLITYIRNFTIIGVVFIIGIAPFLYLMLDEMRVEGDFLMEGQGFADEFSADVLGFFVPCHLHPMLGRVTDYFNFPARPNRNFVFIGYTALALVIYAAVSALRSKRAQHVAPLRFWILAFLIFVLISLGPALRVNGHAYDLPLPFDALLQLPFFKGNRYPSRYSVMIVLCVAVLVGYALQKLHIGKSVNQQISKCANGQINKLANWQIIVIAGLIAFEHLSVPLPLSDLRVPRIYEQVAAEAGDFAVLELPLAWRNGFRMTGTPSTTMMYEQFYQTTHHKRILGGNTSRNPEFKFQYFTEAPLINSLIALELGNEIPAPQLHRDGEIAADVLRFFNARYVVIHTQDVPAALVNYVEGTLPVTKITADGDAMLYRVALPPPPAEINLAPHSDTNRLYLGAGWGAVAAWRDGHVWAQRRAVKVQFPELQPGDYQLELKVYALIAGQVMRVQLNGHKFALIELRAGWGDYQIALPAAALAPNINRMQLQFTQLYSVAEIQLADRAIGGTGATAPVNILAQSAGSDVGDFGHIYVNGVDYAPNQTGYNIVAIDPVSGAVERAASFNTHTDWDAPQAMSNYIASITEGYIAVAVVKDEAADVLRGYAVRELQTIGATGDLRDKPRWSHAVIGTVRTAQPGQAVEDAALIRPAQAWVGEAVTEPEVAAAFANMRISEDRGR